MVCERVLHFIIIVLFIIYIIRVRDYTYIKICNLYDGHCKMSIHMLLSPMWCQQTVD